jgi:hypothetical protein
VRIDEEALTEAIVALASEYGRYGYRRITALLQSAGWQVGEWILLFLVPQFHEEFYRRWRVPGIVVVEERE